MAAKVLQEGISFLGKVRKAGEIIGDEEMSLITAATRDALIGQRILEVDGFKGPGAPTGGGGGLSAAAEEKLDCLVDAVEELRAEVAGLKNLLGDKSAAPKSRAKKH